MTDTNTLVPTRQLAANNKARFPDESADYRAARNALLVEEIELRRHIERVAAQRRLDHQLRPRPAGEEILHRQLDAGLPLAVDVGVADQVRGGRAQRIGPVRHADHAHERVLLHSPLAFDASTYELWVPLLNGGRVVVAPPGDLDVEVLRRTVSVHGVTGLWLTSGLFRIVA